MVAPHDFQARFPEPEELGLLQECFDRILKSRSLDRVGAYANAVATALFTAYERGITEKGQLIRLADLTMLTGIRQQRMGHSFMSKYLPVPSPLGVRRAKVPHPRPG